MVLLPNFLVPNPLDHINEALIFFQNIADIKNLAISNNLLNHEYTEIRFKVFLTFFDYSKFLSKAPFQKITSLLDFFSMKN